LEKNIINNWKMQENYIKSEKYESKILCKKLRHSNLKKVFSIKLKSKKEFIQGFLITLSIFLA
jgi:hypothetical protein